MKGDAMTAWARAWLEGFLVGLLASIGVWGVIATAMPK